MNQLLTKTQARQWLDEHGHAATALPRKGYMVLNSPPIYMLRAGIITCWRLIGLGHGSYQLTEEE